MFRVGGVTRNHRTPDIAGRTSPFFLFFRVLTLQRGNLFSPTHLIRTVVKNNFVASGKVSEWQLATSEAQLWAFFIILVHVHHSFWPVLKILIKIISEKDFRISWLA